MKTKSDKNLKINVLAIDDRKDDNIIIEEGLSKSGVFKVKMLENYQDDINKHSQNAKIVSLDVKVGMDTNSNKFVAKDIYNADPSKVIIYLTDYPDQPINDNSTPANYVIEKKDEILKNLSIIYSRIYIADRLLNFFKLLNNNVFTNKSVDKLETINNQLIDIKADLIEFNNSLGTLLTAFMIINPELAKTYKFINNYINEIANDGIKSETDIKESLKNLLNLIEHEKKYLSDIKGVYLTNKFENNFKDIKKNTEKYISAKWTDTERQYVNIQFPSTCKVNNKVNLSIQFNINGLGKSIDLPFNQADEIKLFIYISGSGFTPLDKYKEIIVPKDRNSELVKFVIVPNERGDKYIYINIFKETEKVGSFAVYTHVD